jgi:uncharacterized protein (TIGR02246 family)
MNRSRPLLLALVLVAIAATVAHSKTPPVAQAKAPLHAGTVSTKSKVRAAVEINNQKWSRAQVKGDAKAIVDLFTDDGMELFSRRGKVLKGRDSLLVFWKEVMRDEHPKQASVTTVDLALSGDYATEVGNYAYTYAPDSTGKPRHESGRYAVIWRRQPNGTWKIWMDTGIPRN